MRLSADPDDLELVWSNLLENAIRFSPDHATVRINMRSSQGRGYVEVADEGPGIPPSELPHIFERFHRGDCITHAQHRRLWAWDWLSPKR